MICKITLIQRLLLALLPMLPGTRSAVVWTVPTDQAPAMLKLSERAWLAEMQKRIGGFLGEISLAGPRSSYPLGFHHAARKRELPERSAGDALRPAFELDEQPRSFGHFPKRFDLVGLLAVRMVYELFPPARYS